MTTDSTNSPKERMDCARVAREQILESYLLGKLSDEDRDAFEEHFFECTHCFDELKTLRALREELGRPHTNPVLRTRVFLLWGAVGAFAAAAILIIGLGLSLREHGPTAPIESAQAPTTSQPSSDATKSPSSETNDPSIARIESPRGALRGPSSAPRATTITKTASQPQPKQAESRSPETTGASELAIEHLARVEPRPYDPGTVPGRVDEATERFRRGMERYVKGDFANAIEDLRLARKLDSDAPHISFFVGVTELMLGHVGAAIGSLRQTIALGDSPYLEDAHFYLAKAFLQLNRVSSVRSVYPPGGTLVVATDGVTLEPAEEQLRQVIKLGGSRSEEAKRLLAEIERIKER